VQLKWKTNKQLIIIVLSINWIIQARSTVILQVVCVSWRLHRCKGQHCLAEIWMEMKIKIFVDVDKNRVSDNQFHFMLLYRKYFLCDIFWKIELWPELAKAWFCRLPSQMRSITASGLRVSITLPAVDHLPKGPTSSH